MGMWKMEIGGDGKDDGDTWGYGHTGRGDIGAVRCHVTVPGVRAYSAARSTPGKRAMAKGAMLWDGCSPRLSSHSSFPTTGASLNPWPVGRRVGGHSHPHSPSQLWGAEGPGALPYLRSQPR